MRSKEDLIALLRKSNFTDINVVALDREKAKDNRSKAKAFAARLDRSLAGFQDSDMILVALTVRHKP